MVNNLGIFFSDGKYITIIIFIFIFGVFTFLFQTFHKNEGYNLIMILISQEIILFYISSLLVNSSMGIDDANLILLQELLQENMGKALEDLLGDLWGDTWGVPAPEITIIDGDDIVQDPIGPFSETRYQKITSIMVMR